MSTVSGTWVCKGGHRPVRNVDCGLLKERLRRKEVQCCSRCHEAGELQEVTLEDGRKGSACCTVMSALVHQEVAGVHFELDANDTLRAFLPRPQK
jgi:hypothetical protein